MRKKQVIFTSTRLFGIQSSRLEHIDYFNQNNWKVYVVTSKDDNSIEGIKSKYEFIELNYPRNYNFINWIICFVKSYKILNKIKPDLIISFNSLPIFITSLVNKYFKTNAIMVFTGSGKYIHWKGLSSKIVNFFLRNTLNRKADYIFQNPEDMNYFIQRNFTLKTNSHLIKSSGVNLMTYQKKKSFNNKFPYKVLMITRFIKEKGINEYLQTVDVITRDFPGYFEFTLAGEELKDRVNGINMKLMQKLIKNKSLNKDGYISKMQEYLKQFDIFIYPSYYTEGVPRVCLEAAATGLPVITTHSRGCNLTVDNGNSGFLVKKQNVEQIVSSLLFLKNNPTKLMEFSKNARNFIQQNFDKQKVDKQYIKLYSYYL